MKKYGYVSKIVFNVQSKPLPKIITNEAKQKLMTHKIQEIQITEKCIGKDRSRNLCIMRLVR